MPNVNVTYQDMSDAARRLDAGEQEIAAKLDELKRHIDGLVNAGYVTDSSSKQFESSYTEFTQGTKNVVQGLNGMAQYLDLAAQTFRDADEALGRALVR